MTNFLKKDFIQLLQSIPEDAKPLFGKMNPRQMTEHLLDSFDHSNGRIHAMVVTPDEKLQGLKDFLMSDKAFRPETKNHLMPPEPVPPLYPSFGAAIDALEISLYTFFERFSSREKETENHPIFGPLNFEEWVTMHYKHATHHLRQFGALPSLH